MISIMSAAWIGEAADATADWSLALPALRKDWADELGLTPEALYRTLAALQREGVVTLRDGKLQRGDTSA